MVYGKVRNIFIRAMYERVMENQMEKSMKHDM